MIDSFAVGKETEFVRFKLTKSFNFCVLSVQQCCIAYVFVCIQCSASALISYTLGEHPGKNSFTHSFRHCD